MPSVKRTLAAGVPPKVRPATAAAITFGVPTIVAVVLSVIATGAQVANQVALTGNPQWQAIITVFLVFLAGEAIRPLSPGGLATLVHIPEWLATLLTAVSSALAGVLQLVHIGHLAHVLVLSAVTFLVALGYGGTAESVPVKL